MYSEYVRLNKQNIVYFVIKNYVTTSIAYSKTQLVSVTVSPGNNLIIILGYKFENKSLHKNELLFLQLRKTNYVSKSYMSRT